ncbi:hypothetical protein [Pontibacter cellulosilyticus]|uniref:Lipoprotein n=1 Tax=Pontibacter cellulosilyticus TaxID=1720253 RepID=A0A923SI31_9BACT|nr:hypothetical protein [Pontibacter cellulosilyticus]MBC5992379.1 hypothetical protein [Pontibacter cellulosilyticus]
MSFNPRNIAFLIISTSLGCAQEKTPAKFYYYDAYKEAKNIEIDNTQKVYQLNVSKFDPDSVEISFIKFHSISCPLDGIVTQVSDTIYLDFGQKCDPNETAFITEAAKIKFIWKLKLKNPDNYKYIPRGIDFESGETWLFEK